MAGTAPWEGPFVLANARSVNLLPWDRAVLRLASGGLADAARAADGLLIHGSLAEGIPLGHFDGAGGIRRIKVSADFLGQSFSALVDSAAAHHLHVGATVHLAQVVD